MYFCMNYGTKRLKNKVIGKLVFKAFADLKHHNKTVKLTKKKKKIPGSLKRTIETHNNIDK